MLLDADVLIDLLRAHPPALTWISSLTTLPAVSGFAAMELLYGCRDTRERKKVEKFLSVFEILWPNEEAMKRALFDYAPLKLSHNLSAFDAMIAATAVGQGMELGTFNVKHFKHVPGLSVVKPYVR